ncbi:hypothetical protein EYF80_043376 [Liparis tanakae]|uniref:Uncharacterized protein n=1 Tax=Liparis tanakae TaxID=230148 RepID=A0A4Z2FZU3_9TELE|nr:hypothetical protein EYF80_043376 [Liparis tanakae]
MAGLEGVVRGRVPDQETTSVSVHKTKLYSNVPALVTRRPPFLPRDIMCALCSSHLGSRLVTEPVTPDVSHCKKHEPVLSNASLKAKLKS